MLWSCTRVAALPCAHAEDSAECTALFVVSPEKGVRKWSSTMKRGGPTDGLKILLPALCAGDAGALCMEQEEAGMAAWKAW